MTQSSTGGGLTCPVCRKRFERSGIRIASDVEREMATEMVRCVDCRIKVSYYSSNVIEMITVHV